jgi:hypothetical protein
MANASDSAKSDLLFRLVAMPAHFQLSGWQINFIERGPDIDPPDDEDDDVDPEGGTPSIDG